MANHENEKQDRITEEDISAAYGHLKTHHEQTPLTREQMEDALNAAVRDLNRCTVAITTMFEQSEIDNVSFEDLRPGDWRTSRNCGSTRHCDGGTRLGSERQNHTLSQWAMHDRRNALTRSKTPINGTALFPNPTTTVSCVWSIE